MLSSFFAERFGAGDFVGETLWIGHLGHLMTLISFIAAGFSCWAFYKSINGKDEKSWLKLGRTSFYLHGVAVVSIFAALFYMIFNQLFEYQYVWQHSSKSLPLRYIISCFWEGQEGSFLLWTFWHVVLGIIVLQVGKQWRGKTMFVLSFVQLMLASMILGIHVFGIKIGSSPFALLRDVTAGPIFQNPEYLQLITDGKGLNPLLQNYWMVIHPPVLFLGFASVTIPFCYAIGALLFGGVKKWTKPALNWTLWSTCILGVGILMGGAWAYESLSFGGFWAWDPVENASLVPWLTSAAGLHLLVIYRSTKHGLRAAFIFVILSFLLILYSTFLTRSGILGDTSVHAFTDLGMNAQLLFFVLIFAIPSLVILLIKGRKIPSPSKEEPTFSREFWMFIGALVLLVSAIHITFYTSTPVWNKLFGTNLAPPNDAVTFYNNWQVWFAILIASLSAVVQFLSYKKNTEAKWLMGLVAPFIISAVITAGVSWYYTFNVVEILLAGTSIFAVLANVWYVIFNLNRKMAHSGGSVAHIGFGLMLVGILISQGRKEPISLNYTGFEYPGFEQIESGINQMLIAGKPQPMGGYRVTYVGQEENPPNTNYIVEYEAFDDAGNRTEFFRLKPNAQVNPKMGLIANPDTKHYWTKDVFTHVSSVPDNSEGGRDTTYAKRAAFGDTMIGNEYFYSYIGRKQIDPAQYNFPDGDWVVAGFDLAVSNFRDVDTVLTMLYAIDQSKENKVVSIPVATKDRHLNMMIEQIDTEEDALNLRVAEYIPPSDFIIMKALVFPWINILWLGCFVMSFGFLISLYKRIRFG